MPPKQLDATVTGITQPIDIVVSESHAASTTTATINCVSTTLDVGDLITVQLGYEGDTEQVFRGYVKTVEENIPEDSVAVTAHDSMVRAIDYFIASSNPNNPYSRSNIKAETLVKQLMAQASLTNFTFEATFFTFATQNPVEVNLVSTYDFCKMVSDTLTWSLWADQAGQVHFENRKPYPMTGASGQPGDDVADVSIGTYTTTDMINFNYRQSDRDLRNRVVVYGAGNIFAERKASSPYLPADFYKSVVLAWEGIDNQNDANKAADYNLSAFNRLTEECSMTIEGDPSLSARQVLTLNETRTGTTGDWYIFTLEHNWGRQGYTNSMELRR